MKQSCKVILFLPFLSALSMLGYFSSDMYLPAFPQIVSSLNTSIPMVQLTFSTYMFGLAAGQIFYGILSDRIGRKITLIYGLSIYTFASIGCFFSSTIEVLLFFRILQAIGACSGIVLWQAIVLDKYSSEKIHTVFSIIFPLLGVSPAIAPVIGGIVSTNHDWHYVFLILAFIGILLLFVTIFLLDETTTKEIRNNNRIHLKALFNKHKEIITSKIFFKFTIIVCLATSAFYSYLSGSAFLFEKVGYSTKEIGFSYIPQTLAFMLGGMISKKLTTILNINLVLKGSIFLALISSTFLMLFTSLETINSTMIIVPFSIIAFCNGIIYPTCMTISLSPFRSNAGIATGISGFLQAICAATFSSLVAALSYLGSLSVGITIFILFLLTTCFYFVTADRVPMNFIRVST